MPRTTAADFQKRFGTWNKIALEGNPVIITSHKKDRLVLVSHDDWEIQRRDAAAYRRSIGAPEPEAFIKASNPEGGLGYEDAGHRPRRVGRLNLIAVARMEEMVGFGEAEAPPEFDKI